MNNYLQLLNILILINIPPHKTTNQDLIFTVAFFNDSFLEGYGFSTTTITIVFPSNDNLTKTAIKKRCALILHIFFWNSTGTLFIKSLSNFEYWFQIQCSWNYIDYDVKISLKFLIFFGCNMK